MTPMSEMPESSHAKGHTIVIIDDEELVRFSMRKKLTKFGYNVISLDRAEDALYMLKNEGRKIDFIITDIRLRKMDGIELLRHISNLENPVPVLLTGQGNIDDAIQALRYGACDFVRKPMDANAVASIIRNVLKRKHEEQLAVDMGKFVLSESRVFLLPSDVDLANTVAFELTKNLHGSGYFSVAAAENISQALRETLVNAMFHGNLEVNSDIRETHGLKAFNEEVERRRTDPQFASRRVTLSYRLTPEYVEYTVEDMGRGFDYRKLPDPRDPENFFKKSGRGLLIVRIHMDEVEWNETGNIIRMKKFRFNR
jgi:DNA-binding response OmpR family regulator